MLEDVRASRAAAVLCWLVAVVLLAWAAWRLAGIEAGYPVAAVVAWTPWAALFAPFALVAAVILQRWAEAALIALAVLILTVCVLPRAFGGPQVIDGGQQLRLVSYNVSLSRAAPGEIVELVTESGAHVLFLQELTAHGEAELEAAGIEEVLPFSVIDGRPDSDGSGIYSSLPLNRAATPELAGTRPRNTRATLTMPDGTRLAIESVHPEPPLPGATSERWAAGLESLPSAQPDGPLRILAGDFNATLDHPELRAVIERGYRDAADSIGAGLATTWPDDLFPPRVAIDHVLADRRIAVTSFEVHRLTGSDHAAISAELSIPPADEPQDGPAGTG